MAFDIGANIGNCTTWFLEHGYDKVVCAEPDTWTFNSLQNRFNYDGRVVLLNVVLSNEPGDIDFYESSAHTVSTADTEWINASRFAGQFTWTRIRKQATTLSLMVDTYGIPDFLKIDVEGYEFQVIKGLNKKIECTIGFEWAEEKWEEIQATIKYLQDLGYTDFSFTYADSLNDVEKLSFSSWENCKIHNNINPSRKDKWGMIYIK